MLPLRDHQALRPSKLNQAPVNDQPHESFRPAPTPRPMSASNEVTECEHPPLDIGLYRHGRLLAKREPTPHRLV